MKTYIINVRCQSDSSPSGGWPTRIAEVADNGTNECVLAVSAGIASIEDFRGCMPENPMTNAKSLARLGCIFPVTQLPIFSAIPCGENDPLFPLQNYQPRKE